MKSTALTKACIISLSILFILQFGLLFARPPGQPPYGTCLNECQSTCGEDPGCGGINDWCECSTSGYTGWQFWCWDYSTYCCCYSPS